MKRQVHQHVTLINGRTKEAHIYSDKFCRAICEGLMEQIDADEKGQYLVVDYDNVKDKAIGELMNMMKEIKQKYNIVEEDDEIEMVIAWGDVSGAELDLKSVRKARQEEIDYVRKMRLYDKVAIEECYRVTGHAPITVRWIDINKGDIEHPNYRSIFVARDINTHKRGDLFAATPPLEALKAIFPIASTANRGEFIMTNDGGAGQFSTRKLKDRSMLSWRQRTKNVDKKGCAGG